jgi:hypothetical protein
VARRALDKLDKNILLDQGEILADVPFVRWEDDKPIFEALRRGIITSHGCACEDYERAAKEAARSRKAGAVMLHVAPIEPATQYRDRQEAIARGEFLDHFYISGEGTVLKSHVVDLTKEQAIPASVLSRCMRTGLYRVELHVDGKASQNDPGSPCARRTRVATPLAKGYLEAPLDMAGEQDSEGTRMPLPRLPGPGAAKSAASYD